MSRWNAVGGPRSAATSTAAEHARPGGCRRGRSPGWPARSVSMRSSSATSAPAATGPRRRCQAAGASGPPPGAGPGEGERGADHEAEQVRVGAVVHPGGVLAGHVEDGHEHRPTRPRPRAPTRTRRAGARRRRHHGDEHERPQQVELLLHRQGPEVDEQLRRGGGEVAGAGGHLEPVGARRSARPGPGGRSRRAGRCPPARRAGSSRPRPPPGPAAAGGRAAPRSAAGRAGPGAQLAQQQGGDEEAGDDEEDVDAEEPAGQRGGPQVVDEHGGDRQRAQAVEALDAPRPRGGGRVRRTAPAPGCSSPRLPGRSSLRSRLGAPTHITAERRAAAVRNPLSPAGPDHCGVRPRRRPAPGRAPRASRAPA